MSIFTGCFFIFDSGVNHYYYYTTNEIFESHYKDNREENRVALTLKDTTGTREKIIIKVANLSIKLPNGFWLARDISIDTFSFLWIPTTFLLSLVLATQLSRKRKILSVVIGIAVSQLFVLFKTYLAVMTYDKVDFAWIVLSDFWLSIVNLLATIFVLKMEVGSGLAAMLIAWIIITYKKENLEWINNLFSGVGK